MSKNYQAPEPAILKRKRSRPSDWWQVAPPAPEPPQQQDQLPPKLRGHHSNFGAERAIRDSAAAANRGKRRRSASLEDTENTEGGDGDGEVAKPLKRGPSSITEAEVEVVAADEPAAETEDAKKRKRGRPAQKGKGEEVAKSVKGRRSNTEAELQADALETAQHDDVPERKHGRHALVEAEVDELVNEPIENAGKGKKKRGRPPVTQEQDELVNDPVGAAVAKKKRGKSRSVSRAEEQTEAPDNGEAPAQSLEDGKKRRGQPRSVPRAGEQPPDPPRSSKATEASKSLRRGRSSNTQDELRTVAEMPTNPHPGGKNGGQRSQTEDGLNVAIEPPPETKDHAPAKRLRRGRPPNTETEVRAVFEASAAERVSQKKRRKAANAEDEAPTPTQALVSKKRTRQSDAEIVEAAAGTFSTQDHTQRKRRRKEHDEIDEPAAAQSSAKGSERRRSRDRLSDTVVEVETATSSFARNRNTSKKAGNLSETTNDKTKKSPFAAHEPSKSRRRQQLSNSAIQQSVESQSHGKKSKGSAVDAKRKRTDVEERVEDPPEAKHRRRQKVSQEEAVSQTENPPTYQHLAPVTRKVSLQTIEAKWEPLPSACVERISQLVQDVQRPVVLHFNDDKKRTEANTALHMISRRLISKLSKGVPFPPPMRKSREDDFDFEKILDHNRALEAQLTPALHANELLESELAKATAHLESEQASLVVLEANAKSEATVRKDAGRRLHSLLQSDSIINEDAIENHLGVGNALHSVLPFSHTEDEYLQDIAQELNGHLETIQGNISRARGISQAMTKSRAAVQATLFDRLEDNEYEDVVLA